MSVSLSSLNPAAWAKQSDAEKRSAIKILEERMASARAKGGLFHATNPGDAYMCFSCGVFGRGGTECWSCESTEIEFQIVPRFGGGSSTVSFEEED